MLVYLLGKFGMANLFVSLSDTTKITVKVNKTHASRTISEIKKNNNNNPYLILYVSRDIHYHEFLKQFIDEFTRISPTYSGNIIINKDNKLVYINKPIHLNDEVTFYDAHETDTEKPDYNKPFDENGSFHKRSSQPKIIHIDWYEDIRDK
jgi:hypothetical protein